MYVLKISQVFCIKAVQLKFTVSYFSHLLHLCICYLVLDLGILERSCALAMDGWGRFFLTYFTFCLAV